METKGLDYELLNENVKKCHYAVRGELYLRASELQKEGKKVTEFCSTLDYILLDWIHLIWTEWTKLNWINKNPEKLELN